ncbi:MAG: HNH endonuclease family protein, partial [Nocardioidaceae bacterium]
MLRRDLTGPTYRDGSHGCDLQSGDLSDPYTGATVHFRKGAGDQVDIDHVVALGNAWATGATGWDLRKRAALANDPMNLLAVSASANRQKGDADSATWLPPKRGYRCAYVARQVALKAKYGLRVTPAERVAADRVLAGCPGQPPAPDSGAPVLAPVRIALATAGVTAPGASGASARSGAAPGDGTASCSADRRRQHWAVSSASRPPTTWAP